MKTTWPMSQVHSGSVCFVKLARDSGEGENKERLWLLGLVGGCLSETNHVGMSRNTAKKGRKRVERVHEREKSK